MTTTTDEPRRLWRDQKDLARIFGEERRARALAAGLPDPGDEPLSPRTVTTYVSRWTNPNYRRSRVGTTRTRLSDPDAELSEAVYAANPPRLPNGPPGDVLWIPEAGETPADVDEAHRVWYRNQPGRTRLTAAARRELAARPRPAPPTRGRRPVPAYLGLADVGRILGQARQARALAEGRKDPGNKPLSEAYVRKLVWQFARPESGYRLTELKTSNDPNAEIYENNPMPAPNGPPAPAPMIWIPDQENGETIATLTKAFVAWYNAQPGPGRRAKKTPDASRSHKRKPKKNT